MLKKLSIFLLLSAPLVLAHGVDDFDPYFVNAEAGGSFSMISCIYADPALWDLANEGYNGSFGNAFMAGIGAGFNLNKWFSLGLAANYRGPFHYCKFQTPQEVNEDVLGFLGTKTRYFNYENSSVMFNLFFNRTGCSWGYRCGGFSVSPYLNLGVGFARNSISNFHSVTKSQKTVDEVALYQVGSVMMPIAQTTASWQAAFGLDFSFCDAWTLGFAYRYFDAGKFCSNNYFANNIKVTFENLEVYPLVTALPWKMNFKTNEFVFTVKMDF